MASGWVRDWTWRADELIAVLGNMKVITAIYLNCRPDLRDEWLCGNDVEVEPDDAYVSLREISREG